VFLAKSSGSNNFFGFVPIGSVFVGTPVTATLTWDKLNHRFITGWVNRITNEKTQTTLPYDFSDRTPATDPTKRLSAITFAANCTAKADWVYIEANSDNVMAGTAARED
jgi:hypothetical protein